MRSYILNFSALLPHSFVYTILNNSNSVENWVSPLPNCVIVASKLTCAELGAVLHSHFGENIFMLVEANSFNTTGWLPKEFWDFIGNPQTSWSKQNIGGILPPPIGSHSL
jgi:hypothetical protein